MSEPKVLILARDHRAYSASHWPQGRTGKSGQGLGAGRRHQGLSPPLRKRGVGERGGKEIVAGQRGGAEGSGMRGGDAERWPCQPQPLGAPEEVGRGVTWRSDGFGGPLGIQGGLWGTGGENGKPQEWLE